MTNLGKSALLIKSILLLYHWTFTEAEESEPVDVVHTPEGSEATEIGLGMNLVAEEENQIEESKSDLLTPAPLLSADEDVKPLPPSPPSPALVFHDTLSSPVLPSVDTF